jgi:hypothetical protein
VCRHRISDGAGNRSLRAGAIRIPVLLPARMTDPLVILLGIATVMQGVAIILVLYKD